MIDPVPPHNAEPVRERWGTLGELGRRGRNKGPATEAGTREPGSLFLTMGGAKRGVSSQEREQAIPEDRHQQAPAGLCSERGWNGQVLDRTTFPATGARSMANCWALHGGFLMY